MVIGELGNEFFFSVGLGDVINLVALALQVVGGVQVDVFQKQDLGLALPLLVTLLCGIIRRKESGQLSGNTLKGTRGISEVAS